jgi:hypothetical protein
LTFCVNAVFIALVKANTLFKLLTRGLFGCIGALLLSHCAVSPKMVSYSGESAPMVSMPLANSSAPKSEVAHRRLSLVQERPGLATTQGREISSKISFVDFQRADRSKPLATAMMYYDDEEGVEAMTRADWSYKGSGLQESADGLIEWGVRSGFRYAKNYNSGSKRFVVGKKDREYSIVIKNKAHSRLEIITSVDGNNVLSGQAASYEQRGHIVEPNETLVIEGFRTNQEAVHAFKFSSVRDSFTQQVHGNSKNVGVIGLAIFAEKDISPWRWAPTMVEDRLRAAPF